MDIEVLLQDVRDQLNEPISPQFTNAMFLRWLNTAQKTIQSLGRCIKYAEETIRRKEGKTGAA